MHTSLLLLIVLALAACSPAVSVSPSPVPPTGSPPSASPTPVASPSASATVAPSVAPSVAFAACDLPAWHANLPSGRMVRVTAATAPGLDTLTFQFVPGGENPGTPFGDITTTRPPFTYGASGLPLSVEGDHFLQVRFEKMDISDASGNDVYDGSRDLKPGFPALRQAIEYDGFEGVIGWFVGMSGPTCVSVASDPAALTITLRIAHP
ncbi:MAG: hypothetical protein M3P84_06460 [Chloroflexota bacterium]|nr:hypothetical protein [Chloroflexota bacterium]